MEKSYLPLLTAGPLYNRLRKRDLAEGHEGISRCTVFKDYTLVMVPRTTATTADDGAPRRQLLLGKKRRGFGVGKWNGFGGKLDVGETLAQAAARELHEESGLLATEMRWCGQLLFSFQDEAKVMRVHVFEATEYVGEPVETEEMTPMWYDVSSIPFAQMWNDDSFWLPAYLRGQCFEGWFDYEAGGESTNTVIEYQLNEFKTPAEAQHCATASPADGTGAGAGKGVFCAPSSEPAPSVWHDELEEPCWNASTSLPEFAETVSLRSLTIQIMCSKHVPVTLSISPH